jgi:hypothetical protein
MLGCIISDTLLKSLEVPSERFPPAFCELLFVGIDQPVAAPSGLIFQFGSQCLGSTFIRVAFHSSSAAGVVLINNPPVHVSFTGVPAPLVYSGHV